MCLGDLYGALGSPVRVCRTVVLGRRRELVQRVLYILSYFIRCSDLQEHVLPQGQMKNPDNPANPCSSQTTDPTPEKTFPAKPDPLKHTACVIEKALNPESVPGTSVVQNNDTLLTDTKSTNPSSSLESSTVRPECTEMGQECFGEDSDSVGGGLEHILANQSPLLHRVQFHIGSPRETENEGQAGGLSGAECGRGLDRKLHQRLLTDIQRNKSSDSALGDGGGHDEETSPRELYMATEQKEYELPLPR